VRTRRNRLLGGWSAYFGYGTLNAAYREVDRHVCDRVRRFLNRRAKRGGRGARAFSWNDVFGKRGVQRLTRDKPAAPAVSLTGTLSESRMRQIRTSGLMSGEGKPSHWPCLTATAPFLDSAIRPLPLNTSDPTAQRRPGPCSMTSHGYGIDGEDRRGFASGSYPFGAPALGRPWYARSYTSSTNGASKG
jgi:hypothetical protein